MSKASRSGNQAALQTHAKCAEEDWTSLSRAEDRRKLQNRLNQRARRRRQIDLQKAKGEHSGPVRKWIIYIDERGNEGQNRHEEKCAIAGSYAGMILHGSDKRKLHFCELEAAERHRLLQQLQDVVAHNFSQRVLDSGLLLSVTQFNIIRAMVSNAGCLGLTMDLLQEDINSPFNALLPWTANLTALPPSLQPTALQKQTIHHPWIDLCPVSSIRDSLLSRAGEYDDDELCHAFFMEGDDTDEKQIGMVVWGEPWDPKSYEISVTVIRKWSWLAYDCPDIISSTNYWRARRGKEPLQIQFDENGKV
ncbi:hypothetical protein PT974_07872 [Cladobotryum mycophilum]|uniref:BZIP domain-containing protein n=1 Tax=Cladobotryum mycophilum TaxID=491253 RepID=A0ABR0SBQ9_9HYPO